MKKYLFATAIITLISINLINAQKWQWAKNIGGKNNDFYSNICTDQSGNLYVSGYFELPKVYFQSDTYDVNGFNDILIAKYDNDGNEIWVKQFGGPNGNMTNIKGEGISDLIYDPTSNSIYAAGIFYETCSFGKTILKTSNDDIQIFIAKFDLNGNCIWAIKAGSAGDDEGAKLALDQSGNVYAQGYIIYNGFVNSLPVKAGGFLAKFD
jgi:hypothetical protein